MVGRISFRWMALPSCLHLNLWHSAVDNTNTRTGTQLTNRSRHMKYLILFFIAFVFFVVLFVTMDVKRYHSRTKRYSVAVSTEHGENSNYHYGIVVDCGSSGSRVFIYYWPQHNGNPDDLLKIKQMRSPEGNPLRMKIKPGISTFAEKPFATSDYLDPLLEFAAKHVPSSKHAETPLYILATAGMRLLPKADQESILDDLQVDIPIKYQFHFTSTHAQVISGKQEVAAVELSECVEFIAYCVYSWIGVNYVLGRFNHSHSGPPSTSGHVFAEAPREPTVGSLDMGGASAQVAFEVSRTEYVPSELLADVNLGCDSHRTIHNYRVYVTTFLGFGSNAAHGRYMDMILMNHTLPVDKDSGAYLDPCSSPELTDKGTHKGRHYLIKGTGDYTKCQELLYPLLNASVPCPRTPCSFNGVYQPKIDFQHSEFYGFSEYWYSMHDVLRIGGQYSSKKFKQAVTDFCHTRWPVLQKRFSTGLYPFADNHRLRYQCFKSAWMTTVFHRGLGFPENYHKLRSALFIGGKEMQWTLGAMLYLTRFLPLREIQHSHLHALGHVTGRSFWSYASELEFRAIFFICSVIVLAAIVLYCRRLQRMSKRSSALTFTTYTSAWTYSSKQPVKTVQPDTYHQVMPI